MTKPFSNSDLNKMKRIAANAVPGPWEIEKVSYKNHSGERVTLRNISSEGENVIYCVDDIVDLPTNEAKHISAFAPDTAIALIDEILSLREQINKLQPKSESPVYEIHTCLKSNIADLLIETAAKCRPVFNALTRYNEALGDNPKALILRDTKIAGAEVAALSMSNVHGLDGNMREALSSISNSHILLIDAIGDITTFMEKCVSGEVKANDIDDHISMWRENAVEISLSSYLGMSQAEYDQFASGRTTVEEIIDYHRQSMGQGNG